MQKRTITVLLTIALILGMSVSVLAGPGAEKDPILPQRPTSSAICTLEETTYYNTNNEVLP